MLLRTAFGAGTTAFFAPRVEGPGVAEAAGLPRSEAVRAGGFGTADDADGVGALEGAGVAAGVALPELVICATGA